VAKYYYFPGWHQPSSVNSIIVHLPIWNKLSADQKQTMEDACKANILEITAEQVHAQIDALNVIEKAGRSSADAPRGGSESDQNSYR
jgi:TRAP-type mannitol/chloroaromatic compound transport system substrate-binding protein